MILYLHTDGRSAVVDDPAQADFAAGDPGWTRSGPVDVDRRALYEGWTPTAANVNALPEPVRRYVTDLATRCDPSGYVRDLTIAKDTIRALEASNRMLRDGQALRPGPITMVEPEAPTSSAVSAPDERALFDKWWASADHTNCDQWHAFQAGRASLSPLAAPAEPQPCLTVRLTSFPESNGKTNWTALLVRSDKSWGGLIGNCGGITIDRGELWNQVAYEAERAKFLIGERDTEPHILDYGDDIKTPEEWAGEVRGGRPARPAAAPATRVCKLTECQGKPRCGTCLAMDAAYPGSGVAAC